jgi:hypothetical protein
MVMLAGAGTETPVMGVRPERRVPDVAGSLPSVV